MTSEERHKMRYIRRKQERKRKKKQACFDDVFSYENLYESYLRCRKRVGWKASTQKYITQAPLNVYRTKKQLDEGKYKSQGFHEFTLYERGKKRQIRSVKIEERIVQRCLCEHVLTQMIENTFIYDNGASLKGKGYHFAINRITRHLQYHYRKHGNDGYILLFDFSKFFDHVSHKVVKEILHKNIEDEKIISLIEHFINCFGKQGMGLGSQISQSLALASVNKLDHAIKEKMKIKCYGRYMDDGYLIHHDKEYLKYCLKEIKKMCDELGIILNEKKTMIVKLSHGFAWLKCRFFLTDTGKVIKKINKKSITRERRKLKNLKRLLDAGKIKEADAQAAFQSWKAYANHFNAYHTIKNMEELYNKLFRKE